MVGIYWTKEAKLWLKEIHDYISEDNIITARKTINKIIQKTEILKTFPESGSKLEEFKSRKIRYILYKHYRIVYWQKSADRIDILGVYHGSLDLKRHFKL